MPTPAIIYVDSHHIVLQDSFNSKLLLSLLLLHLSFLIDCALDVILHSNTAGLSQATDTGRKAQDTNYICNMRFVSRSADCFEVYVDLQCEPSSSIGCLQCYYMLFLQARKKAAYQATTILLHSI
jgi:hypothetical protein